MQFNIEYKKRTTKAPKWKNGTGKERRKENVGKPIIRSQRGITYIKRTFRSTDQKTERKKGKITWEKKRIGWPKSPERGRERKKKQKMND